MGRRKIEIRAIKDDRNRSVTFLKRKGGLFKKAHELSVLCSVDVAVIIFGHNKKLYEFSSGDIAETLRRYQYYGHPHEHKGPADFKGKGGGDDDEDEDEEEDIPHTREDSLPPGMLPPHLQHHEPYPHIRHEAPSASPPMPNGMFQQRHGTPQPQQVGSRPSSRNAVRRTSSNLIPLQHPHPTPPPPQNGFAYVPNPPIYNPNANPPPHPSPQPPFQSFQPPTQQQSHQPPSQQQQPQQQPPPPPQQQHPHPHAPQQPQPQPQPSHQQIQQAHQAYIQEQRRQSQPQNTLHPPPQQQSSRASPQPEQQTLRPPETISPPQPKHLSSKSRSIFTPIDDGGSVLAQHFFGAPDPPRGQIKNEGSPDIRPPPRSATAPRSVPQPPSRAQSNPVSEFAPPSRTNTSGSKSGARPKLNLQIPSEASDEEGTAGSSPHQSANGASANPTRGDSHIVLPPPSPSASAVLSAGASGPPNPFARPPPPMNSNPVNAGPYGENRNSNTVETPMSALPSRFINDNLLPSPGGFYDWDNFGRNGLNSAVLPSPLTFQTPVQERGPSFARGDHEHTGDKRKGSEERIGEAKKVKT